MKTNFKFILILFINILLISSISYAQSSRIITVQKFDTIFDIFIPENWFFGRNNDQTKSIIGQ